MGAATADLDIRLDPGGLDRIQQCALGAVRCGLSGAHDRRIPKVSMIHHGEQLMPDHILIPHALLGRYRHFEVHNELISDELFSFATIGESPESYQPPVVAEFSL